MLKRTGDAVAASGAYALLTLVLTWPLVRGIGRDVPADLGDPLLNVWILSWDADHMWRAIGGNFGALREYWHANIFHPHPLALAYSEHLTPQALMILPVWALTKNPFLCYNLAFLATFVLSALGMYLFVRELTASRGAAFVAGVAYGFAPYRFGTMSHVQILSSMWMPLALLGIHRFLETRRAAALAAAAAAWTIQNLSCSYYLVFFSPILVLYVACEITRRNLWTDTSVLIRLATALALVALATAPFVAPYMQLRQLGFSPRSLAETASFSADVYGYATADVGLRLWGGLLGAWPRPENALFPGFTIGLLAALALLGQWRTARRASQLQKPKPDGANEGAPANARRLLTKLLGLLVIASSCVVVAVLLGWTLQLHVAGVYLRITRIQRVLVFGLVLFAVLLLLSARARQTACLWFGSSVGILALLTVFAFAMSLGPQIYSRGRLIAEWNVYSAFYDFVPGFDGLRVPARFAMVVALGLAALAGQGAALFARGRHGATYVALATTFIAAESWAAPIPLNVNLDYKQSGLTPLPPRLAWEPDIPPVYRVIAGLPPSSAVIELPYGEVAFETRYMIYSISHWRRLVNGYSGGMPDRSGLWAERFKEVLDKPAAAWQAVIESQATHIVVHEASFSDGGGPRVSEWAREHGAHELAAFGGDRIFSID
jgi:hypothetical protein